MSLIPASVAAKFAGQLVVVQKHAPQILFAGGIVGGLTSTVLACRATLGLEEVFDEAQETLDKRRAYVGQVETTSGETYSEQHLQRDTLRIYITTALKVTRLYAPAIVVGGLSIAALTKSHNMQAERIAGLTAALSAVEKAFDKYRERVRAELGEEKDREFRYGKVTRELSYEDEQGKKRTKKVKGFDPEGVSMYAKLFNEHNKNWVNSPEYNVAFLRAQQAHANYLLQARGHVFLNDVYDALGFERTKAGAVVGWIKGEGDDYVDFGVWADENRDAFHAYMTGDEGELLLDFNVQGKMWDRI